MHHQDEHVASFVTLPFKSSQFYNFLKCFYLYLIISKFHHYMSKYDLFQCVLFGSPCAILIYRLQPWKFSGLLPVLCASLALPHILYLRMVLDHLFLASLKCSFCLSFPCQMGNVLTSQQNLRRHLTQQHENPVINQKTQKDLYKCLCLYVFQGDFIHLTDFFS